MSGSNKVLLRLIWLLDEEQSKELYPDQEGISDAARVVFFVFTSYYHIYASIILFCGYFGVPLNKTVSICTFTIVVFISIFNFNAKGCRFLCFTSSLLSFCQFTTKQSVQLSMAALIPRSRLVIQCFD